MRKVLRWAGIVLGGLLALVVVAATVLYVISSTRINKHYDIQVEAVAIPSDEAAIARGRHIAEAISVCQGCHGENLEGQVLDDEPMIVTIAAPNLTTGEGGVGSTLTDADLVRAIRHGVGPDGRPLMIMHSDIFHSFSEQDLAAVIAYVRSVPPVDNQIPATGGKLVGRIMMPLGVFDSDVMPLFPAEVIDQDAPFETAPPQGVTAEYGGYLTAIALCKMCHGPDLTGGPPIDPVSPAAPNIQAHAAAGGWTEQQFLDTIRTGQTPSGRSLNPDAMPWEFYAKMTDEELQAIYLYLASLSGN